MMKNLPNIGAGVAAGTTALYLFSTSGGNEKQSENSNKGSSKKKSPSILIEKVVANPCRPLVLCGPSGAGKSTLIHKLQADYPEDFGFSVSHTTRKPRNGEIDGVDYNFCAKEAMQADIDAGLFIESANVHNNIYGTSKQAVSRVVDKALICILDIDVQGVKNFLKNGKELNPLYVFVAPPSVDALEKRLRGRGTETEDSIKVRLTNAVLEMEAAKSIPFNHTIINNNIDEAYIELKKLIKEDQCACSDYRKHLTNIINQK